MPGIKSLAIFSLSYPVIIPCPSPHFFHCYPSLTCCSCHGNCTIVIKAAIKWRRGAKEEADCLYTKLVFFFLLVDVFNCDILRFGVSIQFGRWLLTIQ